MSGNDLSKSRIINVNDFIFRQNLEFYPNLRGLSCEDNIITLIENGEIIASVPLTFDLRTLPGEVWLRDPIEFLKVIKLNKKCQSLYDFLDYLKLDLKSDSIFTESEAA